MYVPHFHSPFFSWWISRMILFPTCCEWRCNERGCAGVSVVGYTVLQVDVQESWLSPMVDLVLVFWGTFRVISKVDAPVYSPTSSVAGFPFLHIHANTCCHLYPWWWPFVLIGMRWNLKVVFTISSLVARDTEHFLECFPGFVISFENSLFPYSFEIGLFFLRGFFFSSSIFWLLILYKRYKWQIISSLSCIFTNSALCYAETF